MVGSGAVSAVHDGYVLQKSIARAPIGGKLLTQCMLQSIESKGITVKPPYSFKRSLASAGQWEVCVFTQQLIKSLTHFRSHPHASQQDCSLESMPVFSLL